MPNHEIKIRVSEKLGSVSAIWRAAENPKAIIMLAHGAGAGMNHKFMSDLADQLNQHDLSVIRFNFPYIEAGRKAPGSPKDAEETVKAVVRHLYELYPKLPIFCSGKSYGGRMSSQLLAKDKTLPVKGLVFYGFPLHAPGKDSDHRAEHLYQVEKPMLFLQGSNDKLANLDLISSVVNKIKAASLKVFEHADHSFKVPKKVSQESLIPELALSTHDWITQIID